MVQIGKRKITHPWIAVFVYAGVALIAIGAITDPLLGGGNLPAFAGIYGMTFTFFGLVIYSVLYAIRIYAQ